MKNNIKIGAMVVFREENLPINKWQLGHVVKVYFGAPRLYKLLVGGEHQSITLAETYVRYVVDGHTLTA